MGKNCANCRYFHAVHVEEKDGKISWFDSLPNLKDENGKDKSVNAFLCTKFSNSGDVIKDIHTEGLCEEFEPFGE